MSTDSADKAQPRVGDALKSAEASSQPQSSDDRERESQRKSGDTNLSQPRSTRELLEALLARQKAAQAEESALRAKRKRFVENTITIDRFDWVCFSVFAS